MRRLLALWVIDRFIGVQLLLRYARESHAWAQARGAGGMRWREPRGAG